MNEPFSSLFSSPLFSLFDPFPTTAVPTYIPSRTVLQRYIRDFDLYYMRSGVQKSERYLVRTYADVPRRTDGRTGVGIDLVEISGWMDGWMDGFAGGEWKGWICVFWTIYLFTIYITNEGTNERTLSVGKLSEIRSCRWKRKVHLSIYLAGCIVRSSFANFLPLHAAFDRLREIAGRIIVAEITLEEKEGGRGGERKTLFLERWL